MIRISTLSRAALVLATVLSAACSGDSEPEPEAPPAPSAEAAAPSAAAPAEPPASPRDTAEARVAERRIYVDYGRPSMRGRTIMGGLVPYGQVWRTGANAATNLVTDVDLRIGETAVPAGTYTLYTLPGESAWQLIVNRQTGQWGTEYDPAQDLARIPMRVERTSAPVEQFAINLRPAGSNALDLVLEWESTRASVPVQLVLPGGR